MLIIFKDGSKSKGPSRSNPKNWKDKTIKEGSVISRVDILYCTENASVVGIQFFDKEGKVLVQAGGDLEDYKEEDNYTHETIKLTQNERLVGFRSCSQGHDDGCHSNVQFAIGARK